MTKEQIDNLKNLLGAVSRLDTMAQEDEMYLPYKLAVAIRDAEQCRWDCWDWVHALSAGPAP